MSTPKSSPCSMCAGSGRVPRLQWRTLALLPRYRTTPTVLCRDCEGSGEGVGVLKKVLIFFRDGSTWRTGVPQRLVRRTMIINREGTAILCERGETDDEGIIHYHEIWPG